MQRRRDLDFSYAGLKNGFRVALARRRDARGLAPDDELDETEKANLAAAFQATAIRHLEDRLRRALGWCEQHAPDARALAVVGGVAANAELRARVERLCDERNAARGADGDDAWRLVVPPPRLCTDNGVMVAWAAIEKLSLGCSDPIEGDEVKPRWPLGEAAAPETLTFPSSR